MAYRGSLRLNQLKSGAVLSYLVIAIQVLAGLLFVPLALRILGQAEYGLYELSVSIIAYLNLLTLGFAGAYMRFYFRFHTSGDHEGVARLNGLFMLVYGTAGTISTLAGLALAANAGAVLGPEFSDSQASVAQILFSILTLNLVIAFPTSVFTSFIIAHERFIAQKLIQLLKALLTPLAMLLALIMGTGSIGMVAATTIINALLSIYTVWFARRKLQMRFRYRGLQFGLFKEVTVFSSYLFINMVVEQINWNADKFIIGRFHGPEPVAIYGIAALFSTYYMTFSTAISGVFVPRVNSMVARGLGASELTALFIRVGRVQFLVLGLVLSGVVIFGKPFMVLWAGRSFQESYYLMLLLMVPVTIPLLQNLGIEIQKAQNLHKFRTWAYLILAVANILVTIPVAREYGPIGAALVTGLSFLIGHGLIMNWYYHQRIGLDVMRFWGEILRLSVGVIPAIIFGVFAAATLDLYNLPILAVVIVFYVFIYAIGMWLFGMNGFERHLLLGPIQKRLRRTEVRTKR